MLFASDLPVLGVLLAAWIVIQKSCIRSWQAVLEEEEDFCPFPVSFNFFANFYTSMI